MRMALMETLQRARLATFEFLEADDGQEALEKCDPRQVHLAFLDWNLPGISGVNLVRRIRAREDGRRIPLILVGGDSKVASLTEALDDAGATACLAKPFSVEETRYKLQKIVEPLQQTHGNCSGLFGKVRQWFRQLLGES